MPTTAVPAPHIDPAYFVNSEVMHFLCKEILLADVTHNPGHQGKWINWKYKANDMAYLMKATLLQPWTPCVSRIMGTTIQIMKLIVWCEKNYSVEVRSLWILMTVWQHSIWSYSYDFYNRKVTFERKSCQKKSWPLGVFSNCDIKMVKSS